MFHGLGKQILQSESHTDTDLINQIAIKREIGRKLVRPISSDERNTGEEVDRGRARVVKEKEKRERERKREEEKEEVLGTVK